MAGQESQRFELIDELAEDFAARYRRGEHPSLQEYIDRHPDLADDIRELLPALAEVEQVKEDLVTSGISMPAPAAPLEQIGDFRIIREVGKGGMGVVYEAEQVSLARRVALKLLPKKLLPDAKAKQRFEREAKTAAKLHHTNIVPVFYVGEHADVPYFVMQFIQGLGLDDVLDELKRIQGSNVRPPTQEGKDRPAVAVRHDLTAADVVRSLVTGVFQVPEAYTEPAPADAIPEARPHPAGVQTAGRETMPRFTLAASGSSSSHSGSPLALESSSVALPGQSSQVGSRQAKALNYWQSVARIAIQVAEALEYAHKQGTLHRDIKPSNLLLDARGTVWVTDFGLAKANDQKNLTDAGDILGTIRYMPPEAFDGKTDVRSDIYSLGLTLYELLALRPAFSENDRRRLIKEVTSAEPARLDKVNRAIPRDLATMVHKAIDREPSHRYQTAGEFAADLQRFLDDEPIRARRISASERAWRWCRRNPAVASLLAAVFLLMATVAGVTSLAALHFDAARMQEQNLRQIADAAREKTERALQREADQRRQADLARADAVKAQQNEAGHRRLADLARGEAEGQRKLAEANFRQARMAVDDYLTRVSESRLLRVPGMQPLRKELLASALQYYKEFLKDHGDDPALRKELASAYVRMAKITADIASPAEAITFCDTAEKVLRELRGKDAGNDALGLDLAACRQLAGKLHGRLGRLDAALQSYQDAYGTLREISPQDPHATARAHRISGANAGAVPTHRSNDPDMLIRFRSVLNDIGTVYQQMGELGAALYWCDQAILIQQSLVKNHARHPRIVAFKQGLAEQWDRQGRLQGELGMYVEARACHQMAQKILTVLLWEYPRDDMVADFRRDLAASREHEGESLARTDELTAAWNCYASAAPLRLQLARENPAVSDFQAELAECHFRMGELKLQANQPGAALTSLQQAISRLRPLVEAMPEMTSFARMLSRQLGIQGRAWRESGNPVKATEAYQEARRILEKLAPTQANDLYELALWRAACEEKPAPALEALGKAIESGYRHLDHLEKDAELARLRVLPEFQKLLQEVRGQTKKLRWLDGMNAALTVAAAEKKDLFLWFGASDWAPLDAIARKTRFERAQFIAYADKHFVMVDLDSPRYKPRTNTYAEITRLMAKWSISGHPTGVLADATGRAYAMFDFDREGTQSLQDFIKEIEEQRQVRVQRDDFLTRAEKAEGIAKARLLDDAIGVMQSRFAVEYADTILAIHALDGTDQAGLRAKYENWTWAPRQKLYPDVIDLREKMAAAHPQNTLLRTDVARVYYQVGRIQHGAKHWDGARRSMERAAAIEEALVKDDLKNDHRHNLGRAWFYLGDIERNTHHLAEAVAYWRRATDVLSRAPQSNNGKTPPKAEAIEWLCMIGVACSEDGFRVEAEAALNAVSAIQPDAGDPWSWFASAGLAVQLGKTDRYRQICQAFARLPADAARRHWIARLNMLAPGAYANPDFALKAAQREFDAAPTPWYRFVLGAAHYRAGRYKDAERLLLDSMEPKESERYLSHRWFWLAMACARQGKAEEAERWLQKATTWAELNKPGKTPGGGPDNFRWGQRLELRLLQREAEMVVAGNASP